MDAPVDWGGFDSQPEPSFVWKPLSEIPIRPIVWVEYPFLQGSAFHLLAGIKNSGKGTWLANVAARITTGDLCGGVPRRVLWISAGEDSYATDIHPRVEAAGGFPAGVLALDGYGFTLPGHTQALEEKVIEAEAAAVIIDPLGGVTMGSSQDDWNVRPALSSLNTLADRTGTMVFGVRHISNKTRKHSDGILSGILGSSDWVNIPRAIMALIHDDVDPAVRHLFTVASNRAPSDTPGLMMRIEGVPVEGQNDVTVARILGESFKDPEELITSKRVRRVSRSDSARAILLDLLQQQIGHQMESDTLDAEVAQRSGLTAKTIRNLRNDLRNEGLLRAIPVRDSEGIGITGWLNALTNAGVLAASTVASTTSLVSPTTVSPNSSLAETTRARGAQHTGPMNKWSPISPEDPANDYNPLDPETSERTGSMSTMRGNQDIGQSGKYSAQDLSVQLPGMEDSPRSLDHLGPDHSENPGPMTGKPNSQYSAPVSTDQMPEWERAWHERRNGDDST